MNRCPITYEPCGDARYSQPGLRQLSTKLTTLEDLPYTAQEQRRAAATRAAKMSVQGIQPKVSAILSIKQQRFEIVDQDGTFIIKPPSDVFHQVPENEDLTMKMARAFGIEVPLTGLVYAKDGSLSYFVRRFDRPDDHRKLPLEDFAQLTSNTRDTKYRWSMEKLLPVLETYCTLPTQEKQKLFRRVLFCFVTGNEDMHLKNFSLITRNGSVELSPAYDLLNTTIAVDGVTEELALPLAGKKSKIDYELLFEYYGKERMRLAGETLLTEQQNLWDKKSVLEDLINVSFLNEEMKDKYRTLLAERYQRIAR